MNDDDRSTSTGKRKPLIVIATGVMGTVLALCLTHLANISQIFSGVDTVMGWSQSKDRDTVVIVHDVPYPADADGAAGVAPGSGAVQPTQEVGAASNAMSDGPADSGEPNEAADGDDPAVPDVVLQDGNDSGSYSDPAMPSIGQHSREMTDSAMCASTRFNEALRVRSGKGGQKR